ncbi:MAG: pyruvate dehydrogenase (acetyl-transferring) E1 component subunit alpha [Candidatus Izemoplasmatales bacterium]|nr:pyruvate dehydrogenase (acetyl-transferring) E1 component subunit alpha [bacterium]MDZ4196486.1 pyruvate dehydrogenase (acetyl-transferring) E1 component subunit alpha [Candidatus Izemoplasmatales bacterium]
MLTKEYDPLKKQMFQILDELGKVINPKAVPKIDKETLLRMYRTMSLGRIADDKAIQFQRQGRMLTYAPNHGQEACQIGPMAASRPQDWLVLAFREFNAMLYKGVTLEQAYLYWYGNEAGSRFDDGVNVLPVNIPIGSQLSHAAGLAYAAKVQKKDEVSIVYIGDGGTSHGEFHEGLNFAAVLDAPMIVVIQNNQWAISTPRHKATKAETLAQKAIAYGIPGIQVDGNDVLAMYAVTKEAIERARKGDGPTLIEAVTYRIGPHTTSDNPKLYRSDEEVELWVKKDPIVRFRNYIMELGLLTEEQDAALQDEQKQYVLDTFKKVEDSGLVPLEDIFRYTYETMPKHLQEQLNDYKKYLKSEGL